MYRGDVSSLPPPSSKHSASLASKPSGNAGDTSRRLRHRYETIKDADKSCCRTWGFLGCAPTQPHCRAKGIH